VPRADLASEERELLGGLDAQSFLAQHWQKRERLVRSAIAGFRGVLDRAELFALAARDDVESRLVAREAGRWRVEHGPFRARDLARMPRVDWTLLVQGVNLHNRAADALLRRFAFIPYARLDDVMVSYATPGGGVGAHFDSYDVFLLQGEGRRRWRIARTRDLALVPDLPLKILARFRPTRELVLEPGDMLYLPPSVAHEGVALDACMTYSIGFRAPSAQSLATAFLDWLRDAVDMRGIYADPALRATREPARIDDALRNQCGAMLARITWGERDVARFLGVHLSEPKPHVVFEPPKRPLARSAFERRAAARGVRLDARTQFLYDAATMYVNGTAAQWPRGARRALTALANERALPGAAVRGDSLIDALHAWYRDGFVEIA